ncbi:hypothetical protein AB1E18_001621 [Capra hircus]
MPRQDTRPSWSPALKLVPGSLTPVQQDRPTQIRGTRTESPALAEDAQPTESEKEIYNQVNVVLKDAEGILEDLQSYRGAGHEIREMTNPAIQNDFSYYRRTLSRMRINNVPAEGENEVNNELSN